MKYTLRPLSEANWTLVKSKIEGDGQSPVVESEEASIQDVTHPANHGGGVVVNANREVRVKLYIGQVSAISYGILSAGLTDFPHTTRSLWGGSGSSRRSI